MSYYQRISSLMLYQPAYFKGRCKSITVYRYKRFEVKDDNAGDEDTLASLTETTSHNTHTHDKITHRECLKTSATHQSTN